jgi:hypothetical protein
MNYNYKIFYCTVCVITLTIASCRTTKQVIKTVHVVDSTAISERDSIRSLLETTKLSYESQLREASKTSIIFDTIPCPPEVINIDSACHLDSLIQIIMKQGNYINSLKSSVKINTDGTIEANGRVKVISIDLEKVQQIAAELTRRLSDSSKVINNLKTQLIKKDSEFTKNVKRSGFSIWVWVIIFVLGYVLGATLHHKILGWIMTKVLR